MAETTYDVLAIGNAIVDIIARADDDFLVRENIAKGTMNLIDQERAEQLYSSMGPAVETSGGSAANTAAGIAGFGGRVAFIGKVADDPLGRIFRHDIKAVGADYDTPPLNSGTTTARSMILVTPDGERSMNTFLGACAYLSPEDIDEQKVASSAVTYFEGYLWDPEDAKIALRNAAKVAHDNNRLVSMTLSDPFCVDRYREEFLDLVKSKTVDIVFANDAELKSLYQTSDIATAIGEIRKDCDLAAVTMGEEGSVVVTREETFEVAAFPVDEVVDTTGAGDLYAAGFLFGLTSGRDLKDCARFGSLAASEVIQQIGPRPQSNLRDLAAQNGL